MPTANPSLPLHRPSRWALDGIDPRKALVVANGISLSRGVMAVILFGISQAGGPAALVLFLALPMWATDTLDGIVARFGHARGATARTDGALLDPLMDDLAFVFGFLVLLEARAVPVWFVGGLLASRVLFSLIRMSGLAYGKTFARARLVTKVSGTVLAIGQLVLLARVAFPGTILGADLVPSATLAAMTLVTTYSVTWFVREHSSRTLARLLDD